MICFEKIGCRAFFGNGKSVAFVINDAHFTFLNLFGHKFNFKCVKTTSLSFHSSIPVQDRGCLSVNWPERKKQDRRKNGRCIVKMIMFELMSPF